MCVWGQRRVKEMVLTPPPPPRTFVFPRYVRNNGVREEFEAELEAKAAKAKAEAEAVAQRNQADADVASAKQAVLDCVSAFDGDPFALFSMAVSQATEFVSGNLYVAHVTEPDLPLPDPDAPEEEAEAEPEAEPEAAEEGAEGEEEEGEPAPIVFDYSSRVLEYVARSAGAGVEKDFVLARPPTPEDEEAEPEASPLTFQVLDGDEDVLDVPNVLYEDRIRFFRGFPRLGAYYVTAAKTSTGEKKALLCCDSMLPAHSGAPLPDDQKEFLGALAEAIGSSLDKHHQQRTEALKEKKSQGQWEELAKQLQEISEQVSSEIAEDADEMDKLKMVQKKHQRSFAAIKDSIAKAKAQLALEIVSHSAPPPNTFRVLRAAACFLGEAPEALTSWRKLRLSAGDIADQLIALSSVELDEAQAKLVRAHLRGTDASQLEGETPIRNAGNLLLKLISEGLLLAAAGVQIREREEAENAAGSDDGEAEAAEE